MKETLICPECEGDDIHHLCVNEFNPYWYRCQECFYAWSPETEKDEAETIED
jgi:uncharacterized Zn finger protein